MESGVSLGGTGFWSLFDLFLYSIMALVFANGVLLLSRRRRGDDHDNDDGDDDAP